MRMRVFTLLVADRGGKEKMRMLAGRQVNAATLSTSSCVIRGRSNKYIGRVFADASRFFVDRVPCSPNAPSTSQLCASQPTYRDLR